MTNDQHDNTDTSNQDPHNQPSSDTKADVHVTATVQGDNYGINVGVNYGSIAQTITPPPPEKRLHQLRAPIPDFIGRHHEIEQLTHALQAGHQAAAICGLRGMGGIGKTELAILVANQLAEHFPDGQLVIELFGAANPLTPERALQNAIRAFEPQAKLPDDLPSLKQLYTACLHHKRILILADDAKDVTQIRSLLPPTGCALLVTSRPHIRLPGMHAYTLGTLSPAEAQGLLLSICPRIGDAAAELVDLCGYLPLALRVSATFLEQRPTRSVATYLQNLRDEQTRLATLRDPQDPLLNVEASLALSYHGLSTPAQHAFVQLGVFVGSFTPAAAQAVVEVADNDLADLLDELTLTSLLDFDQTTQRYDLHDLVRTFARTHLTDPRPVHLRHAQFYKDLTYNLTVDLYLKGQVLEALTLFDQERRQIDAAWYWLLTQPPTNATNHLLLDLANATAYIGDLRYDLRHERIPQLQAQASVAQRLNHKEAQGTALGNLGIAYAALGEVPRAIDYYHQQLVIARAIGDRRGEGNALGNLGTAYRDLGEVTRAIEYYHQRLTIARAIGDRRGEGNALNNLGLAFADLGEVTRAIEYYEQSLTIKREIGDRRGEGNALGNLGNAYADLGEVTRAIEYHQQRLTIARDIGDRRGEGTALGNLGTAYKNLGEVTCAIEYYHQRLTIAREIGDRRGEGNALGNLGLAYQNLADYPQAITYYESCIELFRDIGDSAGVARNSWNLGLLYEQQGDLPRAIQLIQVAATFFTQIGHAQHAEMMNQKLEEIKQQLAQS